MIHVVLWGKLQVLNEVLVPGPGKVIGWDVKRDFFNPTDLIPVVGPLLKLNKARKILKHRSKIKYYVVGGLGVAADVFAVKETVEWYNARYRSESPSSSRSGNADVKISGGGGTKKKTTTPGAKAPSRSRGRSKLCGAKGKGKFLGNAAVWSGRF